MAQEISPAEQVDVVSFFDRLELMVGRFGDGLDARIAALRGVSGDAAALNSTLAASNTSVVALALQIVPLVLVTIGVFILCRRRLERPGAGLWWRFFSTLAAVFLAVIAAIIVQRFMPAEGLAIRTLRIWILITAVYLLVFIGIQRLLTHGRPVNGGRKAALIRSLAVALAWSMLGVALMTSFRLWNAGTGLHDLFSSLFIVLPAFALFGWAAWRNRRTLAAAVAGTKPRHRWHSRLARIWPCLVITFLGLTFLTMEIALTMGVPLPNGTVFLSIVIVFLTPHIDALISHRANTAMQRARVSIVSVALWQTLRFAMLIVMLTMLGAIWASPLAAGFGINLRSIASEAVQIALISVAGSFLWNILGTVMARIADNDSRSQSQGAMGPRSRLGTLVPLIRGLGKATIVALVFLSVLVTVHVNVWPLITGLSVFGLAIGIGSQTLVKDIVSGLFFLVDDAFRLGEYIETSGAKGTVEKISVRSVTLRNPRGPVATVPYGQISKVVNFSRDYAIDKIQFRVAFDTDVELLRKLFKKIGQDLLEDPELAPDIIETFKSQGISNVEDGTLVIRGKFVSKPGHQTAIQRAVLKAVHQAFRENGIKAVPKPLTGDPVMP